jgi:outer membrane protein assembly factor BamB
MKKTNCLHIFIIFFILVLVGCSNTTKALIAIPSEAVAYKHTESEAIQTEFDELSAYKKLYKSIKLSSTPNQIKYENLIAGVPTDLEQAFPDKYTDIEGVLTFRGNNYRDSAAWGKISLQDKKLEKLWEFNTSFRSFGGGGGWTGQPVVIKWPEQTRQIMNIKDKFKEMQEFIEVVFASLDGKVYFFELTTGEQTREPIDIKNTIKGSVALDPRGYPLLYVGQGLNESGKIGYRIFSLIDNKLLYFLSGTDGFAYRSWGAFDGAPLINRDTDTMILGGENGLLYKIKLNTKFDIAQRYISVEPEISKYRYKIEDNYYQGIENSVAIYKDIVYFADNGGSIQAVNISSLKPLWIVPKTDDTDATITINIENDIPYLYTGCEVDKQGSKGISTIRKINGLTGAIVGTSEYTCRSILGEHPVNGGLLASPVLGEKSLAGSVIFTIARYEKLYQGLMIALNCKDGKELWRWEMPNYSWSSAVDVYDEAGNGYLIQGDSLGKLHLLDGKSGSLLDSLQLNGNIESSPVVFDNYIVIATRGGTVYGVKIK